MVNVIILKGKSLNNADTVSVKTFPTEKEALDFCHETTNMVEKYWTAATIIQDGEVIGTYKEYLM